MKQRPGFQLSGFVQLFQKGKAVSEGKPDICNMCCLPGMLQHASSGDAQIKEAAHLFIYSSDQRTFWKYKTQWDSWSAYVVHVCDGVKLSKHTNIEINFCV